MLSVPFLDLTRVNAPYQAAIETAVAQVMRSGRYVLGPSVEAFEAEFAGYCGAAHGVGVASGLDALTLVLRAWDFPPGSEVIVASNAYIACLLAISQAGLTPVLVEPDPYTYLLDASRIENAITPRTRAIMAVHLYGRCCEMDAIRVIAQRHQLLVLEDAAQAHGATYKGKRAGTLGDAAAWSFYPTKNLGALGDAGAVTTQDAAVAAKLRALRQYGSEQRNVHAYRGTNSRLDELQAAVLRAKLPFLEAENAHRRQLAVAYLNIIQNPNVGLPPADRVTADSWHLFVIRHARRDELRAYLQQHGVGTEVHYPTPPHRQPAYTSLAPLALPISEQLHREVLSLPLNPAVSVADAMAIGRLINAFE